MTRLQCSAIEEQFENFLHQVINLELKTNKSR